MRLNNQTQNKEKRKTEIAFQQTFFFTKLFRDDPYKKIQIKVSFIETKRNTSCKYTAIVDDRFSRTDFGTHNFLANIRCHITEYSHEICWIYPVVRGWLYEYKGRFAIDLSTREIFFHSLLIADSSCCCSLPLHPLPTRYELLPQIGCNMKF
jgi:hypothetical protein